MGSSISGSTWRAVDSTVHVLRRLSSILTLMAVVLGSSACDAADSRSPTKTSTHKREQLALFRVVTSPTASGPRYDIVVVNADGSRMRVLVGESQRNGLQPLLFDRPSWSADGQSVVFSVDLRRSRGRVGNPTDLYTVRANGTGLRRLTRSGRAVAPVWSPSGSVIAYAQRIPSDAVPFAASLWSINASGGPARQLLPPSIGEQDLPSSWSPDGSRLAFTRSRYDAQTHTFSTAIYTVWQDGTHLRRLASRGSDPAWSPDGRRIAFVTDRDENGQLSYGDRAFFANELYVMNPDGGHPVRLTQTKHLNERSPSWSPDGRTIAYQRGRVTGNAEGMVVVATTVDGTCTKRIAAGAMLRRWYARPSWRPGGSVTQVTPSRC
jgi:Tol biopolymer transport system component